MSQKSKGVKRDLPLSGWELPPNGNLFYISSEGFSVFLFWVIIIDISKCCDLIPAKLGGRQAPGRKEPERG